MFPLFFYEPVNDNGIKYTFIFRRMDNFTFSNVVRRVLCSCCALTGFKYYPCRTREQETQRCRHFVIKIQRRICDEHDEGCCICCAGTNRTGR